MNEGKRKHRTPGVEKLGISADHEAKSKKKIQKTKHENDNSSDNKNKIGNGIDDNNKSKQSVLSFDYKYIVAPMVGASELPFRLLCRKYGAQLIYTPMMIASEFVISEEYRQREFQTTTFDRPLVCHFAANTPKDFVNAAKLVEHSCDAIDLNLGCPQRTAYVGHFGSYLLDDKDRQLIVNIVRAGVQAVKIPIFCKIRLLDTYEETFKLCQQLYDAGASLIAIHARYRATFHRKGPGARDGPALLDQVQKLRQAFEDKYNNNKVIVTNGNTITYEDVVKNLEYTQADGIMSAEGILDNPALYLERLGSREESDKLVEVKGGKVLKEWPKRDKWMKKMEKIESIEVKVKKNGFDSLNKKDKKKLSKKDKLILKLRNCSQDGTTHVPLSDLYKAADDKVQLALEYIQLVRMYPVVMRTVIFHTRRIIKAELTKYQLMEECLTCASVDQVEKVILKIRGYQNNPVSFQFDIEKSKKEREALERKRIEEGKRREFEARMIRKAKREGKKDLEFYLQQGTAVPSQETVQELKKLSKEAQLKIWKDRDHSQHCIAFHLLGECPRGRGCAFLHVAPHNKNTFEEHDEVAG